MILNDNEAPAELKATLLEDPTSKSLTVKMAHTGSGGDVLFDFNEESNGTKRFYELSSILIKLTTQSHFVTIDELESKMHPDLYQHFLTTYLSNAGNSQMVFTTHIREFLNDKDSFRDDCVWFTEKTTQAPPSFTRWPTSAAISCATLPIAIKPTVPDAWELFHVWEQPI